MSASQRCLLKRAPNIEELTADCAGPSATFTSGFTGFDTRWFTDQIGYRHDDLLQVVSGGITKIERYKDMIDHIGAVSSFDPNPRTVGSVPPRRWLITRHDDFALGAKRVNYLRGLEQAHLSMIVATGPISFEAWWQTESLSTRRLVEFFKATVLMASPWQCGGGAVLAAIPAGASSTVFNTDGLRAVIGAAEKMPSKSHVIYFNPAK